MTKKPKPDAGAYHTLCELEALLGVLRKLNDDIEAEHDPDAVGALLAASQDRVDVLRRVLLAP